MDNSDYTPSAVTRLMAPALMLALATWLLADSGPAPNDSKPAAIRPADAAGIRGPVEPQQAGKAGVTPAQQVATGKAIQP